MVEFLAYAVVFSLVALGVWAGFYYWHKSRDEDHDSY